MSVLVPLSAIRSNYLLTFGLLQKRARGIVWEYAPYQKIVMDALEDVLKGTTTRLIINMPPRYGKSDMASVLFPAIAYGHYPDSEFILVSYSKDKAQESSIKIRDLMQTPFYRGLFPETKIRQDSMAKDNFRTTEGGVFYAAGIEGGIAGWGVGKVRKGFGGALIIDDALNPNDILSTAALRNCVQWYQENVELSQRFNSGLRTPIIVIMQRLAVNDLVGYLLSNDKNHEWRVLSLPALNEDNNTALWPERHSVEELKAMRAKLPMTFAAQFQQNPVARGGNMFKRDMFEEVEISADFQPDFTFSTADLAATQNKLSDYTVWSDWAVKEDKLFLLRVFREKLEAQYIEDALRPLLKEAGSLWSYRGAYIEPKLHGIYLNQKFRSEGLQVVSEQEVKEFFKDRTKSKEDRAQSALTQLSTRKIYINKNIAIKAEIIEEAVSFPRGAHDDWVDTCIDAIKRAYIPQNAPQIFWI